VPSVLAQDAPATPAVLDLPRILTPLPLTDESPAHAWPHGVVSGAAFSPDGRELALACRDGTIAVCSLEPRGIGMIMKSRGIRMIIRAHPDRVWSVAFSPDGKILASAAGEWSGGTGSSGI